MCSYSNMDICYNDVYICQETVIMSVIVFSPNVGIENVVKVEFRGLGLNKEMGGIK